jgi:zinc protease
MRPSTLRSALILAAFLCLPPVAAVAQRPLPPLDSKLTPDPVVTTGTLPNGLRYYVRTNGVPEHRVQFRLAVKTGSVFEADDQRGLAHMLEHMAFNGTAHFKPDELVNYFESAGARFGAHVNAQTSFDDTIYMLQVASDRPGLVDKALLALSDFAGGMTLDPAEIDKERGVVIEEWRLGQGAGSRLFDKQAPVVFYHSRYAERLPIGTPEILKTFTPQRLRDFYETWYRPDRMAVSVVGDADPAAIVKTIEQYFGPMKPKRAAVPEPERALPPHAETVISIASDSEAQASTVTLMRTSPTLEDDRVGDYRRDLVRRLMFQMMNVRFGELARKADAPFLAAGAGEDTITAKSSATTVGAQAEDGRILDALRAMIVEARRARQFGFSEFELEQGRRRLLSFYETAVAEKGKTESASYADEYIRNFLTGEPFPGIQAEYDMTHAMLPGVTLAEIGESAKALLQEDNRAVLIAAPAKASVKLPDEAAVRQALSEASTQAIEPWKPQEAHSQLIGAPPVPGHITGTREIAPLGVTVVTLSNGVDVWLKSTDFKNDEVLITGVARGGAANAPADDYLNTVLAASLVNVAGVGGIPPPELASMLAGRLANVTPYIDLATRGVRGAARPQDLELALQLTYLNFTSPNADDASLALMKRQLNALVANRETDPGAAFADKVRSLNTGDSRLVRPISAEGIASLKLDKMHQAYVDAFGNAADFTFFIVGTFKVEDVKPLLERYVASLPSRGQKSADVPKPIDFRFPAAVSHAEVAKGREPRSETAITYFADATTDDSTRALADMASDVLEIRLRELLREKLGGTYSVSVSYSDTLPDKGYGSIGIDFGSSPENAKSLAADVLKTVAELQKTGPTAEEVHKVVEQERQDLETAARQNGYWLSSLQSSLVTGRDPLRILGRTDALKLITIESLHKAFVRFFPSNRYTVATLMPEAPAAASTAPPAHP